MEEEREEKIANAIGRRDFVLMIESLIEKRGIMLFDIEMEIFFEHGY